jgi:hypothetical protein
MTKECRHDWFVWTTFVRDITLGVSCEKCGAMGYVPKPSKAEWAKAFDAPSNPYRFDCEHTRVRQ